MQQERWQRVDKIFHLALKVNAERRAAFLEETCSGDRDLWVEVERLLTHYNEADTFLEQPAIELAADQGPTNAKHEVTEGDMVSHYRVGAKLGCGGMGVVYEAEDLKLRRGVALKFLYDDMERDSHAVDRLQREAQAASRLNHPNICTIYAIEEHRGQPVLVMELLEGENLSQRVKAGPAGTEELVRIGRQACDALSAAHAKGIIHRDIKPANIFVTTDGRLKLLDFGIATWARTAELNEHRGKISGTLLYMSPEQLRGEEIDGRSDLFSLGVTLYELATGIRPFERGDALSTMEAVLNDSVTAPSSLNPSLPAGLNGVIGRMIEKDRERRYSSAADVSNELALLDKPSPRTRTRWKLAGVGAGGLVLCGAAVTFFDRRPAPALSVKDTMVLADFVNKTGDAAFNQTLRPALAVEIRQSPYLSLISEGRIQHVLGLMAKPAATPLTAETAREICERTGSAAVLDGSIANGRKGYVLTLRAQNCRTGELLYSEQAEAAGKEDILGAIGQLAGKFRKRAGESLTAISQHPTWLSEATTPSFEAWKSYTEGTRLAMLQGHAVAIPFLKRAIDIDPHFASALALLGRDYSGLGEMELAREYTRRAFEERDRASDEERFFIEYSNDRIVTGNLEKALQTAESWTRAYPRNVLGLSLYGAVAKVLGNFDKAVEENRKALAVDADQPYAYVHLATVAVFRNNYAEAERWLERASERKLTLPDYLMIRHLIAFLQGDKTEMERVDLASEGMSEIQDWIWGERADVLAFSGRLKQARLTSQHAVQVALEANRHEAAGQHEAAAAVREALFGHPVEAQRRATAAQRLSRGTDAQYGAALAFAFAGDSVRSEALTKDLEQRYPEDTIVRFSFVPTLRAIAAIQRGTPEKALELLEPAARYELGWLGCCSVGFVGSLYPIYVRGEAYLALHRGQEAAAQFKRIIDNRGIVGSNPIALLTHWKRGKALAMAGNSVEAKAEYQRFLSLCAQADADVPILRHVKDEYGQLVMKR